MRGDLSLSLGLCNCLDSAGGLPMDLPLRCNREKRVDKTPPRRKVVDDQNSFRLRFHALSINIYSRNRTSSGTSLKASPMGYKGRIAP